MLPTSGSSLYFKSIHKIPNLPVHVPHYKMCEHKNKNKCKAKVVRLRLLIKCLMVRTQLTILRAINLVRLMNGLMMIYKIPKTQNPTINRPNQMPEQQNLTHNRPNQYHEWRNQPANRHNQRQDKPILS